MSEYVTGQVPDVFAAGVEAFTQVREWLAGGEAAGLEHAGLEEQVQSRGRELLRLLLQAHLDLRAAREQRRPAAAGPDGITRTRAETGHTRTLATVFGEVTVTRIAYRAPGAGNVHLADAQLNLPAGKHSHGVCEKLAAAAASVSLAAACAAVLTGTGVRVGTRQASQVITRAAADFDSFYARSRERARIAPGQILVLEADGKGIRMLPGWLRRRAARDAARSAPRQHGRLSRGEVRTRKRMAEVGAVFQAGPVPRTAAGVLPGPGGQAGAADGPRARDKWLTASVAATTAQVITQIFAEADRRDPRREQAWIALADGNPDQIRYIEAEAAARGLEVPVIIDFIHVTEYLWKAAWAFFPKPARRPAPGSPATPAPSSTATAARPPPPSAPRQTATPA